jgi:hypothetical protein
MSQGHIALNSQFGMPAPNRSHSPSFAKFFFSPIDFFRALDAKPGWMKAFLVSAVLIILTIAIAIPLVTQVSMHQMSQLSVERRQELLQTVHASQYIAMLFAPVVHLLKLAVGAYLIWGTCIVFGADLNFRKILSLVSYASIIPILDRLAGYPLNYLSGINDIESSSQIRSTFLSVSAFFDLTAHPALRSLLDSLDLFTFWYLALLVVGLSILGRFSKPKSALIVGIFFAAQLVFTVGSTLLFAKHVQ